MRAVLSGRGQLLWKSDTKPETSLMLITSVFLSYPPQWDHQLNNIQNIGERCTLSLYFNIWQEKEILITNIATTFSASSTQALQILHNQGKNKPRITLPSSGLFNAPFTGGSLLCPAGPSLRTHPSLKVQYWLSGLKTVILPYPSFYASNAFLRIRRGTKIISSQSFLLTPCANILTEKCLTA